MTASLSPVPIQKFFDVEGKPLSGGLLWTYASGTSNPLETYTDEGGGTAAANPLVLDQYGQTEIWLAPGTLYRFDLLDVNGVEQPGYPIDGISV